MKARLQSPTSVLVVCLALACVSGCTASRAEPAEPLAPPQARAELQSALEQLASSTDPVASRAVWERAHDVFTRGLEGPIRSGCGERAALEIEYAFALVGAALPGPSSPPAASGVQRSRLLRLSGALERSVGCL